MKPEAQAHTIAKVMDWEYLEETGEMVATEDGDIVGYSWPSLDAMHEAEKLVLDNSGTWTRYVAQLKIQSAKSGVPHFHLEAAQRAEAFLKTLALWTE